MSGHWRGRLAAAAGEAALSEYYAGYVASQRPSWAYLVRHPVAGALCLVAIARLPKRRAVLPATPDGQAIHRALSRPGPLGTPFGATGVAVLDVPADAAEYSLGSGKQTLRRKVRAASRRGITCRPVTSRTERAELLALANRAETLHADAVYRVEAPDNSDLPTHDLWLAAFAADGTPLLLSVTPVEGEWAQLRYFRTLGAGPDFSDSRYLMTAALVDALSARGVRHLMEGTHPAELPNGLRHFQRMVGFRLARVTARLVPAGWNPRPSAGSAERSGARPVRRLPRREQLPA